MLTMFLAEIQTEEQKNVFRVLYELRRGEMYQTALGVLRDAQLAEDAVQEALFYIARNIHKIDDPQSAQTRSYMNLVAITRAKKILSDRHEIPLEEPTEPNALQRAESAFLQWEESAALENAIRTLPEKYRTPLLLFYAQDLPAGEIAKIMGISPALVRKRLERARDMLREKLTKEAEEQT